MIDLYSWQTPNGRKVSIMLEEIGIDYNVFPINIGKDEQFQPHFLEISPNNRIPAINDKDNNNYSLFESGAILIYLAEKDGVLKGMMEHIVFQQNLLLCFLRNYKVHDVLHQRVLRRFYVLHRSFRMSFY